MLALSSDASALYVVRSPPDTILNIDHGQVVIPGGGYHQHDCTTELYHILIPTRIFFQRMCDRISMIVFCMA